MLFFFNKILYDLITRLFFFGIKLYAPFNPKAKKWIAGRKSIYKELEKIKSERKGKKIIWFHASSLGEFEQGRVIIELLKKENPDLKILITFFSPSGYEIRKNYKYADWVFYLPADTKDNSRKFIELINPNAVVFIKYEFWFYYLSELKNKNIPTYLIAATFRKSQLFFKWYAPFFKKILECFDMIFVQDDFSLALLIQHNFSNSIKSGDPRIDRVVQIAESKKDFPLINSFCKNSPILICGSTWKEDEKIIHSILNQTDFHNWKLIIAPHDISKKRINEIQIFFENSIKYSEVSKNYKSQRVLIIDNIGMLSSIYQYGKIAYVGGGFGEGVHNTLEPMAFNLPVIYGPRFYKFFETKTMLKKGGHFSISSDNEFITILKKMSDVNQYKPAQNATTNFINNHKGASETILPLILKCL